MKSFSSMALRHQAGRLEILDQTRLPLTEAWIEVRSPSEMVGHIRRLAVRGAPLIGVAAAAVLAKFAETDVTRADWVSAAHALREARPTAVNLMAAVDRLLPLEKPEEIVREAEAIYDEDIALCLAMAERGAEFVQDGDAILTHCNAGALATAGIGTAIGVIRRAFEQGKRIHVYVDETRPLLQGARLTAWELEKLGVPYTLICDNMAGFLMAQGKIQKIFTGADRIARNGDSANKIGTYSLAVLAKHHGVPFYIVAPRTTFDGECALGRDIPIEQRPAEEVRAGRSPAGCDVWNPAFDVTPRELISAVILDDGLM